MEAPQPIFEVVTLKRPVWIKRSRYPCELVRAFIGERITEPFVPCPSFRIVEILGSVDFDEVQPYALSRPTSDQDKHTILLEVRAECIASRQMLTYADQEKIWKEIAAEYEKAQVKTLA